MSEKAKKSEKKKDAAKKTAKPKATKPEKAEEKVVAPKVEMPKTETPKIETHVSGRKKKGIDLKTWILVGFAIIAFVIVSVAIIMLNQVEKIDSSYFHDADGKIVLTMDKSYAELDDSEWEPEITHVVYYHDNNMVTGARAFYEYKDEAEAKEAFNNLSLGQFADGKKLSGRFVVFSVKKQQYEDLTVAELKHTIELMKEIHALILDYDQK